VSAPSLRPVQEGRQPHKLLIIASMTSGAPGPVWPLWGNRPLLCRGRAIANPRIAL